jgi:hypothetical protein
MVRPLCCPKTTRHQHEERRIMAPVTEQSEYGLALVRGVREASEAQAPDYGLALVRGVIEARRLGQLPGLAPVDDWAGEDLDDTSAQACASRSEAAGRPDTSEAPGQAAQLDGRGAWGEASTSEANGQATPLSSEVIDLEAIPGMSSESMDLGGIPKSSKSLDLPKLVDLLHNHRPPRDAHPDHRATTQGGHQAHPESRLGTVQDATKPEPPVLIPQRESTGGRKPYNVRLRKALVAEVMDRPEFEGLSLAGIIELVLEERVARS